MKTRVRQLIAAFALLCVMTGMAAAQKTRVVIWNWSQEQQEFYNEMAARFNAENPDIEMIWQTYVQARYNELLPLAFRSGDPPDIFLLPSNTTRRDLIERGWVQPIEPYMTPEFKALFDPISWTEGVNVFDGQIYTVPTYDRRSKQNGLMFWNRELYRRAGLDPDLPPATWSEFRANAQKITAAGQGAYFGLTLGLNPGDEMHRIMTGLLSVSSHVGPDGFDYKTGRYNLTDQGWIDSYEFLRTLKNDGVILPGYASMDKTLARTMFAQNRAAHYFDGDWMISVWREMGYPDIDYNVAPPPVPDEGRRGYWYLGIDAGDLFMSSQTEDPEKTARVYRFIHSEEFMSEFVRRGFGAAPLVTIDNVALTADPRYARIIDFTNTLVKVRPQPEVRNPETGKVNMPTIHPNAMELMASAFIQDQDWVEVALELEARLNEALIQAIERARSEGASVSQNDFAFPDWDPMTDYVYSP